MTMTAAAGEEPRKGRGQETRPTEVKARRDRLDQAKPGAAGEEPDAAFLGLRPLAGCAAHLPTVPRLLRSASIRLRPVRIVWKRCAIHPIKRSPQRQAPGNRPKKSSTKMNSAALTTANV
jgi:hypothetical protein